MMVWFSKFKRNVNSRSDSSAVVITVDVDCAEPNAESKTIIVRNLSFDTGEDDVKDAFDGAVNCRLMTYPDTGKSKGWVFCTEAS